MDHQTMTTLIAYNQWANARLLRKIAHLTPQQLAEPNWLSRGNLFRTLLHTLDTQWGWRVACQQGMFPPDFTENDFPNIRAMVKFWKEDDQLLLDYANTLSDAQLDQPVHYSWPRARTRSRTLWHVLFHIVNHSSHHRAEIGQYLHTIGRSPGDMDFVFFINPAVGSEHAETGYVGTQG